MHTNSSPRRTSPARRAIAIVGLALAVAVVAGACSKDSTTSTGSTGSTAPGTTAAAGGVTTSGAPANTIPKATVMQMQENLDKVGCDVGPNDGILGPETLAALAAFQKSAGLAQDDQYGPKTQDALTQAAASGKKDCVPPTTVAPTTTTTAKSAGSSTTQAASTAACTTSAITAGVKASGINLVNLDGFGCASNWAYAFASVSSGPPGTVVPPGGVGVTILLQAQGGNWVVVNRANYCGGPSGSGSSVPAAIYQNACQTN